MKTLSIKSELPVSIRRVAAWVSGPRLFWASLFLLHLSPLWALSADILDGAQSLLAPATVFRLFSLIAFSAFFVLKIADVPWLRLRPGWCSRISAMLVVGLLHVGVVERVVAGEQELTTLQFGLMLSAAAASRGDVIQRRFEWWMAHTYGAPRPRSAAAFRHYARCERIRTPGLHFLPAYARLRAPPLAI